MSELLEELEDYVKDAIFKGTGGDPILGIIINLTLQAERTKRPLFHNILEEPYFYSLYVRRWILEGVDERLKLQKAKMELLEPQ